MRNRGPMFKWEEWEQGVLKDSVREEDLKNGHKDRLPIECPTMFTVDKQCKAKVMDISEHGPFIKKVNGRWPVKCLTCDSWHLRLIAREK